MCSKRFTLATEDPQKENVLNKAAVWGTLASGCTFGMLEGTLSVMDIPAIPYYIFSNIEKDLGDCWKDSLWKSMELAGKEERENAIANNNYDQESTPWITVFLDGGWSKRSYGHNYNAASGVAVIIGKHTGKVLYLRVRNKYCSICARAANHKQPPTKHTCYRNWSDSSSAMEPDIIVEGFIKSIEMHGVKYLQFIANGDSSVHAKIRENVPYGRYVNKIECTNHAIKNYGKALFKLKADFTIHKTGRSLLTTAQIHKMQQEAQQAINANAHGDVATLKADLQLSIHHAFGDHTSCKEYLCNQRGETIDSQLPTLKSSGVLVHINASLDILIKKGASLIDNETNNRAELFMSILAKFNCGKRLNLTQRGSFQTRTYLTGLQYNKGIKWHTSPWKELTHQSPGENFKKYLERSAHSTEQQRVRKKLDFNEDATQLRKKRTKEKLPNIDYGPKAREAELQPTEFQFECDRILRRLQVCYR